MTDDQARTQYSFVVKNAPSYRGPPDDVEDTSEWVCCWALDTGRHAYIPYDTWHEWHREGLRR